MPRKGRKVIFGGSYAYYITEDKKLFIKVCNGQGDLITKEFQNLKKFWNKLGVKNFQLIEPVNFSKEKEFLITKFVNFKTLVKILDPKVYFNLGKKLKSFHNNGFSHSHLEIQDILYNEGRFILSDVPFFNERTQIHDIDTIKLSINMYRLKKPWYWYKYKICLREFLRGYIFEDHLGLEKEYVESIKKRIRTYLAGGKINQFRGHFLKLIYKIRLL